VFDPDAADSTDDPDALLAFTVNVYAVAFVSPVTAADEAGADTVVVACGLPAM
jgi:hypothetical protein